MEARKEQLSRAISSGAKPAAVARDLGVNRSTVSRWLQEPDVQARIAELQGETTEEAIEGLQSLVSEALETVRKAIHGEVPAAQGNHALNVIKAAAVVDKAGEGSTSAFEERLKELDAKAARDTRPANGDTGEIQGG